MSEAVPVTGVAQAGLDLTGFLPPAAAKPDREVSG